MHYHLCIFVFFLNHCWCLTATACLSLQFHQHVVISPFYYIFPRFFLSCVCVCLFASLCMCAYVHMSVHVCAAGADHRRTLMSSLPLSARSLLFGSGVPRVYQHSAVNTRTYTRFQHPAFRLRAHTPTLAFI